MKKIIFSITIFTLVAFVAGFYSRNLIELVQKKRVINTNTPSTQKSLEKYSIENLSVANIKAGKLTIGRIINENDKFTSYLFEYNFYPALDDNIKKTTGVVNIPNNQEEQKPLPLILMIRGYVDQKTYQPGEGTKRAGEYFSKNGLITISPDFLGYGQSDSEAGNIFESRFQTYVTLISLIKTLQEAKKTTSIVSGPRKPANLIVNHSILEIWAHSNGGQIALTTLEVTQKAIPTTLWAPVSKPFPYSVLYYTDDSEDKGKLIRNKLSEFEQDYDVDKYSLAGYFDRINKETRIQIQQGSADESVPKTWSDALYEKLSALNLDIDYFVYPGADHNLQPSWKTAIQRDLEFFMSNAI